MSCKLSLSCCLLILLTVLNVSKLFAYKPVGNAKILFAYQGRVFEYPKDKKLLKSLFGKKGWPKSIVKQVHRYTGTKEFKDFVSDMSAGDVKTIPDFKINYGANKNPRPGEFIFAPKTGDQDGRWIQLKKNETFDDFCRTRLFGKDQDKNLSADQQRMLQKYQNKMRRKNPGRFASEPTENTIDIPSNLEASDSYFKGDNRLLGALARSWYEWGNKPNKEDFGKDGVLEVDEVTTPQTAFTSGYGSFIQSVFDSKHRQNLFNGIHDLKTEMNNSTSDDSRYTNIENPTLQDYLSTEQVNASIINGIWANRSRGQELGNAMRGLEGKDNDITDLLRNYSQANSGDVPRAASIFDLTTNFSGRRKDIKEIFGKDSKPYLKERKELRALWEQCKEKGISYEQFVNGINGQNGQSLDKFTQQMAQNNGQQSQKPLGNMSMLDVNTNKNQGQNANTNQNQGQIPIAVVMEGQKETQPTQQVQPTQQQQVQPTQQVVQPTCQPTYNCQPNYNRPSCRTYCNPGLVRGQPLRNVGRLIFRRRRCGW